MFDLEIQKMIAKSHAEMERAKEEARDRGRSLWDTYIDPKTMQIVKKCPTCHRATLFTSGYGSDNMETLG
tara:strand:- start:462 stop:671 length:210 start_codon:yes stop_codon:yes gene_type:complete